MYEMGSGCELGTVLPTEQDYDALKEVEVRNIVRYIFVRTDQPNFKSVRIKFELLLLLLLLSFVVVVVVAGHESKVFH